MFSSLPADRRIERPGYAWVAVALEVFTAVGAIPVGLAMLTDTTGGSVGLPGGWIEATPFGSYLVPGLYLLLVNGVGMLVAAGLVVARHRSAPWLTAILGVGLVIWIAVQVVVLPETSLLQVVFGATGLALTAIGAAWVRRTGLRLLA
jgi:hypothetical protein